MLFRSEVQLSFVNIPSISQHIKSGKVRALAMTGSRRSDQLPDVPTMKDTIPDFIATTWFANIAPPKTPEPIARAISDTIREAFQTPEAKRIIGGLKGARTGLSTPAEAAAYIRADSLRWKDVIEKNGIKAE